MFNQPPLTPSEVFGGGFVDALALLFGAFVFSLLSMLPSGTRFYLQHNGPRWKAAALLVWPVLGTIGCVVLFFGKKEKLRAVYRVGVVAAYALFVALTVAMWTIVH